MTKKYVISGYYGFNNFGDELILSILCDKLKKKGADITVFSVSPEETSKKYGVKSSPTFDLLNVVKELFNTDVLVSGGGSLFQDATSMGSLLYYSFVLFMAQLFHKETIIYCQGIGPLYNAFSRFLVRNLFSKCNSVSVRDEKSQNLLLSWGIKAELREDPVWKLEIQKVEKTDTLGIQLRSCSLMNDIFLKNLAQAVCESGFKEVKLFSLQKNLDYDLCVRFKNILNKLSPDTKISVIEDNLMQELSSLKMLIAMRFHALIIGLKSDTKCVAINYDPKIQILAEKSGLKTIEFYDGADDMKRKII